MLAHDWQEIIREHGPTVWQAVWRVLGHEADARDCYQDVFLEAIRVSRREEVKNWGGLLRRIATSRAIDLLRARYRRTGRLEAVPVEAIAGRLGEAEATAQAHELADQLRREVALLPRQQGMAFWMHCVEQTPYEQVGTVLKVEPSHARVLVHRARVRLKEALDENQEFSSKKVSQT